MVLNALHLVPRNTFLIWSRWHFFYSPSSLFSSFQLSFHSLPSSLLLQRLSNDDHRIFFLHEETRWKEESKEQKEGKNKMRERWEKQNYCWITGMKEQRWNRSKREGEMKWTRRKRDGKKLTHFLFFLLFSFPFFGSLINDDSLESIKV